MSGSSKSKLERFIDPSLRCEYVLTHGEGQHISQTRGVLRGRVYKVTYDLYLCRFCGNLEGTSKNTPYCPWKLRQLHDASEISLLDDESTE